MEKLICAILLVVFAGSCGNKFSLQKRRYTKGFYFASGKSNKTTTKNSINYLHKNNAIAKVINKETQPDETVESMIVKNEVPHVVMAQNSSKTFYSSTLKQVKKGSFVAEPKQSIQKRIKQNKHYSAYSKRVNFFQGLLAVIVGLIGVVFLVWSVELIFISPVLASVGLGGLAVVLGIVFLLVSLACFYATYSLFQ